MVDFLKNSWFNFFFYGFQLLVSFSISIFFLDDITDDLIKVGEVVYDEFQKNRFEFKNFLVKFYDIFKKYRLKIFINSSRKKRIKIRKGCEIVFYKFRFYFLIMIVKIYDLYR